MKKYFPVLALIGIIGLGLYILSLRSKALTEQTEEMATAPSPTPTGTCIPTFRDGGGPYYQTNTPFRSNLAPDNHNGEKLVVSGKVLRNDCTTPVANAVVDIWQANESGNYEDEWYRGRVQANEKGEYSFETVVPQGYGEGTGYRPPHIHFKIWQDDRELITSQMFMPASRTQGIEEAYIMKLETTEENGETTHFGTHDIVLP